MKFNDTYSNTLSLDEIKEWTVSRRAISFVLHDKSKIHLYYDNLSQWVLDCQKIVFWAVVQGHEKTETQIITGEHHV